METMTTLFEGETVAPIKGQIYRGKLDNSKIAVVSVVKVGNVSYVNNVAGRLDLTVKSFMQKYELVPKMTADVLYHILLIRVRSHHDYLSLQGYYADTKDIELLYAEVAKIWKRVKLSDIYTLAEVHQLIKS